MSKTLSLPLFLLNWEIRLLSNNSCIRLNSLKEGILRHFRNSHFPLPSIIAITVDYLFSSVDPFTLSKGLSFLFTCFSPPLLDLFFSDWIFSLTWTIFFGMYWCNIAQHCHVFRVSNYYYTWQRIRRTRTRRRIACRKWERDAQTGRLYDVLLIHSSFPLYLFMIPCTSYF